MWMLSSSPLCVCVYVCVYVFALWKESESVNLSVESDTLQPHGLHSPPGSSGLVGYGILQVRILELVAIPFFRGSSWPRDWTRDFHIAGRFFIIWATWDAFLPSVSSPVPLKNRTSATFCGWIWSEWSLLLFLILLYSKQQFKLKTLFDMRKLWQKT